MGQVSRGRGLPLTRPVPGRQVVQILEAEGQPDSIEAQKLEPVDHSSKVLGQRVLTPQAIKHGGAVIEPKPVDALQQLTDEWQSLIW